jgi:hypothetical protein
MSQAGPDGHNSEQLETAIVDAIENSSFTWRSPSGISAELGKSRETIVSTLMSSSRFVKARQPNEKGEPLFTTRTRFETEVPLLRRVFSAATNTITG